MRGTKEQESGNGNAFVPVGIVEFGAISVLLSESVV